MANDAQKQRIFEHLRKSTDGGQYSPKKSIQTPSVSPEPIVTPAPTPVTPPPVQNRKQKVMSHVKLSSQAFSTFSLDTPEKRKKQIQEHLKKSLG